MQNKLQPLENSYSPPFGSNDIMTHMQYLESAINNLGLELNPLGLEQFHTYYKELIEWNQRVNLTSITDFKEVQIKHFLDSLTIVLAFKQPLDINKLNIIDIGTGAGFPGLPVKIASPDFNLTLLEATTKKVAFLKHLVQKLGLDGIEIIAGRSEEIAHKAHYRKRFDIVVSRSVASLPTLAELTLPFCCVNGKVILQKKGNIESELKQAAKAIETLGGNQPSLKKIELPIFTDNRYLVIIEKISPTPTKYPRRPGMPAKRPIL